MTTMRSCDSCGKPLAGTYAWEMEGYDGELYCSKRCARDRFQVDDYLSKVNLKDYEVKEEVT